MFRSPSAVPTCRNCGAELATHRERREEFCINVRCRPACMAHLAKRAKEFKRQAMQIRDTHAMDVVTALEGNPSIAPQLPDQAILMIIPENTREIMKQPAARIAEFRDHLNCIMEQAQAEIEDTDKHESIQILHEDRAIQERTSLPVINACTTCGGSCCLQAAGHAFLTRDFFAWRLLNEPDTTPQEKIEDYMCRIPEQAYENSCVYHGAAGCVLPREIRSSTCNNFLCTGIVDGVRRDRGRNAGTSIAVVDSRGIQRIGISKEGEERVEITWPASQSPTCFGTRPKQVRSDPS